MFMNALAAIGILVFQVSSGSVVTTSELDVDPATWDDQMVTVTGEIIGDYGRRPDVVWVQVNDGGYVDAPLVETGQLAGTNSGVGVRIPNQLFDQTWGPPGGYRTRGPVIQVTGVFRYADTDTGGDTYIDARAIELLHPSRPLEVPGPDWALLTVSLVAIAGGMAVWGRVRWRRLNPDT